jgi:hypothetical protein
MFRPLFRNAEEREAMQLETQALKRRVADLEVRLSSLQSRRGSRRKPA